MELRRSIGGVVRFAVALGWVGMLAGGASAQPEGRGEPKEAPAARTSEAEMRAVLLAHENEVLQERRVEIERQRQGTAAQGAPAAVPVALQDDRSEVQPRLLALRGTLQDFFETASLVDQAMATQPLPEGGYVRRQLRFMQTVRDYLRNEGTVAGVAIREVDRNLPARELVEVILPQNAIYLNAYAMERLRDGSDVPGFPLALRYALRSTMLIQEFELLSDPTGALRAAREFQHQLELEQARARGLAEGLGRGVQGAPLAGGAASPLTPGGATLSPPGR